MDTAVIRPNTYKRMRNILILKYGVAKAKYLPCSDKYFGVKCITH
jgi:hypothetical protein